MFVAYFLPFSVSHPGECLSRHYCLHLVSSVYRIFRTIRRVSFTCLAGRATFTPKKRLIYWILSDCVQTPANRWHCIQLWQLKTAVPPKKKKSHGNWEDASCNFPGCCGMDRHSMGFIDDRHHSVGIQKGLIGADGESEDSPQQDMLLHRHRSWRKCLTATV